MSGKYSTNCYSTEVKLSTNLLNSSRYNPVIPLTESGSGEGYKPTVYISFVLVKFLSLTSDTRVFSVQGALDLYWTDPQLYWNTSSSSCINSMRYFAYSVWHPYVFLKDATGSTFRYSMDLFDILQQNATEQMMNGRIYGLFQSSCSMSFRYYPFDSQTCNLKFINYDDQWIEWNIKTSGLYIISTDATTNSDWTLTSNSSNISTDDVCISSGCQTVSMFSVSFSFKRKSTYYVINLVAPTVVMWIMVSLTFVLPSDRGMKVPLAATLMLAIYTQQKTVTSLLPNASPTPYISEIYLIGIYLSALSLITSVLTVLMRVLAPTLPPAVQSCLFSMFNRVCCKKKPRIIPMLEGKDLVDSTISDSANKTSSALEDKLDRLDRHLVELIDMKKEKVVKMQANAANEKTWQRIEFIFNTCLLIIYVVVMAFLFITFAEEGGGSLLTL